MDPELKTSDEKQVEIVDRIAKSKEKYQKLNEKNSLAQQKREHILKEGRMFFHDCQDEILIYSLHYEGMTVGIMEYFPEEEELEGNEDLRYFYVALATLSRKDNESDRVLKGYLGYRLLSYSREQLGNNPFAGHFVVSRNIIGNKPIRGIEITGKTKKNPSGKVLVDNHKVQYLLGDIAEAYFISQFACGEDLDGDRLPSSIIKAILHG